MTLNEQIDYFGQTVNAAARIQGIAKENEIVISQDVYRYQMDVCNPYVKAFVKAFDEGGSVWEGNDSYKDMDEALEALEQGIGAWFHEVTRE